MFLTLFGLTVNVPLVKQSTNVIVDGPVNGLLIKNNNNLCHVMLS